MTETTIDFEALRNLKAMIGGETDDLAELIEDFVSTLPVQIRHMQEHAAKNDWTALRITSHSCKSNSRDMGALQLSGLCAAVELRCKQGDLSGLEDDLHSIKSEADAVMAAISKLDPANV